MFEEITAKAKNQLAAFEDAMHVLHTELEKLRRERDEVLADGEKGVIEKLRKAEKRAEELERLVRVLRRAEKRCSRYEEKFYNALATRWPGAWKPAAEKMEQAREAVDAARNALFEAVERKGA